MEQTTFESLLPQCLNSYQEINFPFYEISQILPQCIQGHLLPIGQMSRPARKATLWPLCYVSACAVRAD